MEKEGLLNDIEEMSDLKMMPLKYHKERLILTRDFTLKYKDAEKPVFENLTFEVKNGDRIFIGGENGCGKSSLIKAISDENRRVGEDRRNFKNQWNSTRKVRRKKYS